MSDLISRQAAIDAMCGACSDWCDEGVCKKVSAIQKLPSAQPDRGYIEQIKWERDLAIRQLADLGYGLGEKPRTNGDTISRQAAIEIIQSMYPQIPRIPWMRKDWQERYEPYIRTENAIRELPSAQPTDADVQKMQDIEQAMLEKAYECGKQDATQWIPCSERLPEERDWYLGIFQEPDTGWIDPLPFICDYLLGTKTKATTKEGWILNGFTDREEYIDYYFNLECVAWMPLPKPYAERRTDEAD